VQKRRPPILVICFSSISAPLQVTGVNTARTTVTAEQQQEKGDGEGKGATEAREANFQSRKEQKLHR